MKISRREWAEGLGLFALAIVVIAVMVLALRHDQRVIRRGLDRSFEEGRQSAPPPCPEATP